MWSSFGLWVCRCVSRIFGIVVRWRFWLSAPPVNSKSKTWDKNLVVVSSSRFFLFFFVLCDFLRFTYDQNRRPLVFLHFHGFPFPGLAIIDCCRTTQPRTQQLPIHFFSLLVAFIWSSSNILNIRHSNNGKNLRIPHHEQCNTLVMGIRCIILYSYA